MTTEYEQFNKTMAALNSPKKWYCWQITLGSSPKARKVATLSFVADALVSEESAVRRARVGLMHSTRKIESLSAHVFEAKRVGPFASIEEAAAVR